MLKVVLLCVFIGGSGVGYVWQKNQIHQLGEQITRSEKRLQELVQQNKLRANNLAQLRSPAALDVRVRQLNLGLVMPNPQQILILSETQLKPALDTNRSFAAAIPMR